jgi:HSP20 family protein
MKKTSRNVLQKSKQMNPFWNFPLAFHDLMSDSFDIDFDNFFNRFHSRPLFFPQTISTSCDIEDKGKEIVVQVDLPGVMKKDIKLNISENSIEISAKHKEENKKNNKNYLKKERTEISYYRVLPLPVKVLSRKAKAKLADGILSITLPKLNPKIQKKNFIPIE